MKKIDVYLNALDVNTVIWNTDVWMFTIVGNNHDYLVRIPLGLTDQELKKSLVVINADENRTQRIKLRVTERLPMV